MENLLLALKQQLFNLTQEHYQICEQINKENTLLKKLNSQLIESYYCLTDPKVKTIKKEYDLKEKRIAELNKQHRALGQLVREISINVRTFENSLN